MCLGCAEVCLGCARAVLEAVLGMCLESVLSMFEVCLECVGRVLGCVFGSACSGDKRWFWSVLESVVCQRC